VTTSLFLRRYWRIALVAVLGALIAFGGSYMNEPTYASSTRLLIRGRDATFLTTTGQDLSRQPGVVDASLSKTLAETEAGIATSREVATMVVDKLKLDAPKEEQTGPLAWAAHAAATGYGCGKAIITHGFCKEPEPREKAIQGVQEGILAGQLGATSGEGAGQPGSYILEIVGSGTSPEQARDITNVAADALVQVSANRFKEDAKRHADLLGEQVKAADATVNDAAKAVSEFKTAHGITDIDALLVTDVTNSEELRNELRKVEVDLTGAQAQLSSLDASIAAIPPSQQTEQEVKTGRSDNKVTTNAPSAVYSDLIGQRANLQALIAGLQAREQALRERLDGAAPTTLNADQAQLLQLDQQLKLAQVNQAKLTQDFRDAQANAQSNTIELTRIDVASTPTYPISPKRYLYLALGLLTGGLAGGGLTWLARRREDEGGEAETLDDDDRFAVDRALALDLREAELVEREKVSAGAGAGSGLFARSGNGNGNGNGSSTPYDAAGGAGVMGPS
jgi:uncharacterized protein involved in exopolysaccharide biosynthesis